MAALKKHGRIPVSYTHLVICVCHFFSVSRESTLTPLEIYFPEFFAISSRGRWIPSKILWMIPGPRSTEMASPVPVTVSPCLLYTSKYGKDI